MRFTPQVNMCKYVHTHATTTDIRVRKHTHIGKKEVFTQHCRCNTVMVQFVPWPQHKERHGHKVFSFFAIGNLFEKDTKCEKSRRK